MTVSKEGKIRGQKVKPGNHLLFELRKPEGLSLTVKTRHKELLQAWKDLSDDDVQTIMNDFSDLLHELLLTLYDVRILDQKP